MNTFRIYLARTGERRRIDTITSDYARETDVEWNYYCQLMEDEPNEIKNAILYKGYYILAEYVREV